MEVAEASQRVDVVGQILNLPPGSGIPSLAAGTTPFSQTLNSAIQTLPSGQIATGTAESSSGSPESTDGELQILFALAAIATNPAVSSNTQEIPAASGSPDALPQTAPVTASPAIPFFPPMAGPAPTNTAASSAPVLSVAVSVLPVSEETARAQIPVEESPVEENEKGSTSDSQAAAAMAQAWLNSPPIPAVPAAPSLESLACDVPINELAGPDSTSGALTADEASYAVPTTPPGFAESLSLSTGNGSKTQSPAPSSSGSDQSQSTADELLEAIARVLNPNSDESEEEKTKKELPADARLKRKETEAKAAAAHEDEPSTIVTPSLIPALMASASIAMTAPVFSTAGDATAASSRISDTSLSTQNVSDGVDVAAVLPGAAAGETDRQEIPTNRSPNAGTDGLQTLRRDAQGEAVTIKPTVSPHDAQTFADRLSQYVLQSSERGEQMTVMIAPPELGSIRIDVQSGADGLTVRFEASNAVTEQLLVDRLPQLHEALAQVGRTADRVDVVRADSAAAGSNGSGTQDGRTAAQQQFTEQRQRPTWLPPAEMAPHPPEATSVAAEGVSGRMQGLNIRI